MSLAPLPVWSFEADWSERVNETYEWLTKVLKSRIGAEQRRSLRFKPRRYVEFTSMLYQQNRGLYDNYMYSKGIGDYYLPMWHEAYPARVVLADHVTVPDLTVTDLKKGSAVWLQGEVSGELHEVQDTNSVNLIRFTRPLGFYVGESVVLHPAHVARLVELPSIIRKTDILGVSQTKFMLIGTEASVGEDIGKDGLDQLKVYKGLPLLLTPPDETSDLDYGYERITEMLDNSTSIPISKDVTNQTYSSQRYTWRIVGQKSYRDFKRMLYALRGRVSSFWIPTFFSDFELTRSPDNGSTSLFVKNTGYTALANSLRNRQDICIEYDNGYQHCTSILSSSVVSDKEENIVIETPGPAGNPIMISFLIEARLDQDNIELAHDMDTAGVTTASVLIRGTPTIRRALPAA